MINLIFKRLEELEEIKNKIERESCVFPKKYVSSRKYIGPIISFVLTGLYKTWFFRIIEKPLKIKFEEQQRFNQKSFEILKDTIKELKAIERFITNTIPDEINSGDFFDKDYFVGGNKSNYDNYSNLKPLMEELGQMLIRGFSPQKVLDAGCAYGFLPIYLRKKRVEAYGVDISEFAIAQGAKNYLLVQDAFDLSNFENKQFDLVIAIELLEHLQAKKVLKVLKELWRVTSRWLVLSIAVDPEDVFEDASHIFIQPREKWQHLFKKLRMTEDKDMEKWLGAQDWTKKVGWSNKFFVLAKH